MTDNINEVGKLLKKTKKNSEAALRRYALVHPRVERIRDIFDDTVSFEMEFETNPHDKLMNMDLFFNKPPPLKNCKFGRYAINCSKFTLDSGDHLIQVTARYIPGSVSVFKNGVQLGSGQFSEYDPINGLVWIQGGSGTQVFSICYTRDTWVPCGSSFSSTSNFISSGPSYFGDPNVISSYGFGGSVYAETTGGNNNDEASVVWSVLPTLPNDISFPSGDNLRISWTFQITGFGFDVGQVGASMLALLSPFECALFVGRLINGQAGTTSGFYISQAGTWVKLMDFGDDTGGSAQVTVTIDRNLSRGTAIFSGAGFTQEVPITGSLTSYGYGLGFTMESFDIGTIHATASAAITAFEIGCSLEAGSG